MKSGVVWLLFGSVGFLTVGCASSQHTHPREHIILVGHGSPASDYPRERLAAFFRSGGHNHGHGHAEGAQHVAHAESAHEAQERDIRNWPRTPQNDPYKFGVEAVAAQLQVQTGAPVSVAFNEFCAPSLDEAIDAAVKSGARRIVVVPTMMTPGGAHSEVDVPRAIDAARAQHPAITFVYAWPYDVGRIAGLIASQVAAIEAPQASTRG